MRIYNHMRIYRKPTGYLVEFWYAKQESANSWSATGAGVEHAFSLRQLPSILRRLNRSPDLQAKVIPIWGPLA